MNGLVLKLAQARENSLCEDTVASVVRDYMPLIVVFGLYLLVTNILLMAYDLAGYTSYQIYKLPYFATLFLLLFIKALSHVLNQGKEAFTQDACQKLYDDWLKPSALVRLLIPLVIISVMMSVFSSMKTLLPEIRPFYLDEFFMKADHFLHFGNHPWEITHSLFGGVTATWMIDTFYRMWFFFLMCNSLWIIINHRLGKVHHQYLLTYVLSWALLGSFMAVALSSAGPCFYGNVTDGINVYAPLMERLNEISASLGDTEAGRGLSALQYQQLLWDYYTDDYLGIGSGITAMPSMHVSFAMLLFLSARAFSRVMGYFMLFYLVMIQIGSVHLGWHYALDGYISMIGTWMIWQFSGWLVDYFASARKASAA